MTLNQEASVASRFQFAGGSEADVARFCAALDAPITTLAAATGEVRPLDLDMREVVEMMDDEYGGWSRTDGKGVVIRGDEPVDVHPTSKIAKVVRVDSLDDAVKHVNVATQTVGSYPFVRMAGYRDRLAHTGAQRVVHLGEANPSTIGNPHGAMYPLHRFYTGWGARTA